MSDKQKVENTSKPDFHDHRQRLKEKYKAGGLKGWLDYEILEFILTFALPRVDTKKIAKELLANYKTINGVLNADKKELKKIKGVGEHSALFLNFLKDISVLYMENELERKDLVSSPQAVYNYLKTSLKGLPDEEFKALFLDNRNQLISAETINKGTVNQAVVYPRKIVEQALYYHANSVIISHNHPGGSLHPSEDDCRITKAIKNALKTVDINLLDHIIIGGESYFSFKENGIEV